MTIFIVRRIISATITFFLITLISFMVIQLPPGDVVSNWVRQQEAISGSSMPPETIENLRRTYGFDEPLFMQYLKIIWFYQVIICSQCHGLCFIPVDTGCT